MMMCNKVVLRFQVPYSVVVVALQLNLVVAGCWFVMLLMLLLLLLPIAVVVLRQSAGWDNPYRY
jgi:hypothetical protein